MQHYPNKLHTILNSFVYFINVGKSTVDKWVRQLKDEHNGIANKPNALTPEQRKIKKLEVELKKSSWRKKF